MKAAVVWSGVINNEPVRVLGAGLDFLFFLILENHQCENLVNGNDSRSSGGGGGLLTFWSLYAEQ